VRLLSHPAGFPKRESSNTYAEPPNSDLLRRYGHIDEPNPNDVVEIDAKLIADVVCQQVKGVAELQAEKVEWLLESGLDE
jgi:SET domain-containing protein 6